MPACTSVKVYLHAHIARHFVTAAMKNWTGEEESSKGAVVISGTSFKAQQKKFLKIHTLVETETTD